MYGWKAVGTEATGVGMSKDEQRNLMHPQHICGCERMRQAQGPKDVKTFVSHPWPTWFRYRCLSVCRWIAIRTGATAARMSKKLDASTAYV